MGCSSSVGHHKLDMFACVDIKPQHMPAIKQQVLRCITQLYVCPWCAPMLAVLCMLRLPLISGAPCAGPSTTQSGSSATPSMASSATWCSHQSPGTSWSWSLQDSTSAGGAAAHWTCTQRQWSRTFLQ